MFHRHIRRARGAALWAILAPLVAILLWGLTVGGAAAQSAQPRTVSFPSADGKTTLTGYLFAPAGRPKTAPAVVLMHGRGGAYLPRAKGNYSAVTLDKDLREWAELWSAQGYWALVVDSFSARGMAAGLPPVATDAGRAAGDAEDAIRPLDAYGALRYLRASPRVKPDRVALEGWSNGASAALAAMNRDMLSGIESANGHGFRAALAFYPGCTAKNLGATYRPYAPVRIFFGGHDSPQAIAACQKLAQAGKGAGGDIGVTVFDSGSRDFDDPMRRHSDDDGDETATAEARKQAVALLVGALGH